MIRKIDELGRIVLPKEMRNKLGLSNGDEAFVELKDNKIIVSNPSEFDLESYVENQFQKAQNTYMKNAYYDVLCKIRGDINE